MKGLLLLLFIFCVIFVFGQNYQMSLYDEQTIEGCDVGLVIGDYNIGDTIDLTICSDDPINNHVRLDITGGYFFTIGCELKVFDGLDTASNLIVTFDSNTVGAMVSAVSSEQNTTGCLHLQFVLNNTSTSLSANVNCFHICENFEIYYTETNPPIHYNNDKPYLNVCWDNVNNQSDSIFISANSNAFENPAQNEDSLSNFVWNFGDGSELVSGTGLNTVLHVYSEPGTYPIKVLVTDTLGCSATASDLLRVNVGATPIWDIQSSGSNPDTICLGQQTELCVNIASVFNLCWGMDTIIADTVAIPDLGGSCCYSDIQVTNYDNDLIINSADDLKSININVAHSYIGDLMFFLYCPDGSGIQLCQQNGGGVNLGNPPNEGFWYSISMEGATTLQQTAVTLPYNESVPPGVYKPYQSFEGLVGCPVNGEWTLVICDNWSSDTGTLFGWWIDINNETIPPDTITISQDFSQFVWSGNPGSEFFSYPSANCAYATYSQVENNTVSNIVGFNVSAIDQWGCSYDTVLLVTVLEQGNENCCNNSVFVSAGEDFLSCTDTTFLNAENNSEFTGNWSIISGAGNAIFNNRFNPHTKLFVTEPGEYILKWALNTGSECNDFDTVKVTFDNFNILYGCDSNLILEQGDSLILNQVQPWGGTYNGEGVINNVFYSEGLLCGFYEICYIYNSGVCEYSCCFNIEIVDFTQKDTQNKKLDVSIYPLPNTGSFSIVSYSDCDISIYDIHGKSKYKGKLFANEARFIELDLSSGVYFLETIIENTAKVQKFLVY